MSRTLHTILRCTVAVYVGLLLPLPVTGQANAAVVTVSNGVQFTDSAGKVLHAHEGGMIKVGQYYYWFGENPHPNNNFRYISVYRSTNLHTWEFRNNVLTQASAAELESAILRRPQVIYNARTKQYVLFMHKGSREEDVGEQAVAVATSSTVDGDYKYQRSFRPLGAKSFDVSVFQDNDRDRTAYLISTTGEEQQHLTTYRLTPDYLGVAEREHTFPNVKRVAPSIFKRNGVYFLVTSGITGWEPNQAKYATATSIKGPWSALANFGDSITYGSRPSYVLPVQGSATTSYLYLGDRLAKAWGGSIEDSEYVWLPLQFPTNRSLSMPWHPQVSIDTATGVVRGVGSGAAYEQLRTQNNDQCLTMQSSGAGEDAAGVTQRACGTAAHQNEHWQVLHLGAGYFRLVARHSHKCLTVPSSSTADEVRLTERACGTGANQQWKITALSDRIYRVTARHSGKCLTVAYDPTTAGPKAIQFTCKGTANQHWKRAHAPY